MSLMHSPRSVLPAALAVLAALTIAVTAFAAPIVRTKRPAVAVFHLRGPAGIPIEGTTDDVALDDDVTRTTIIVGLRALTTGMKLRDQHMRDKYLEVQRFPDTRLEVDRHVLVEDAKAHVIDGLLTLHGVTRKVPVNYRAACRGDVCDVNGSLSFDMREFGVVVPSYFGLTVEHDVTVDVSFQVQR